MFLLYKILKPKFMTNELMNEIFYLHVFIATQNDYYAHFERAKRLRNLPNRYKPEISPFGRNDNSDLFISVVKRIG